MKNQEVLFGVKCYQGLEFPLTLGVEDARRHVYVIGQTGSGKTTLLRNVILQRIEAGEGVALLDPHGDLAEELLAHYPTRRADDLVYFDPADAEFPIGFNPLGGVQAEQRPLVTAGLVAAFKSIWRDSWGPRLEYILANTIAALLEAQNTSLLGVNRMLADERYREWVVRQVKDPFVSAFWTEEFANYDERFLREAIAPIQNKLGQLLLSPLLRNILGQVGAKIDLRYVMDHKRVFIANLSKGRLGPEPANLLGALLVAQFSHAAMTRADVPEEERRDFALVIDEFHNYLTDSFASSLAEARKYRLSLVLAHQYLDQIEEKTRAAVFGNVGTVIVFRVGHPDAAVLAEEFGREFAPEQFGDLGRFEILVRRVEDGAAAVPFRGRTHGPRGQMHQHRDRLVDRSRDHYSAPRRVVEARLGRWLKRVAGAPLSTSKRHARMKP